MSNLKTPVASRPTLQPIAESCASPNSSLHNQASESTNNEVQSCIKDIYSILQQHDSRFKEFETLLNENKQLREDLTKAQELIEQLKSALVTAVSSVPPVSSAPPAPSVQPAPEAGTEASQSSHQQLQPPRNSRQRRISPAAREAAARNFLPISETQGFTFIYLHLRGKEPMSTMRMRLRRLKLQSSRILDIHYPTNNVVALLVHNDYYQEATEILEMQQVTCLPDFVPYSEQHLRDPPYQDKPVEERQYAAETIFHQRLTNIALRVQHDSRKFAVARDFRKKQWITESHNLSISHSIRPPRDTDQRNLITSNPRNSSFVTRDSLDMDTDEDSSDKFRTLLITNLQSPADSDSSAHSTYTTAHDFGSTWFVNQKLTKNILVKSPFEPRFFWFMNQKSGFYNQEFKQSPIFI